MKSDYSWNDEWKAPYVEMPVADVNTPNDVYCTFDDLPEAAQGYAIGSGANRGEVLVPIAYGFQTTLDPIFLTRADEILAHFSDKPGLVGKLEDEGTKELQVRAPLLACAQRGICQVPR